LRLARLDEVGDALSKHALVMRIGQLERPVHALGLGFRVYDLGLGFRVPNLEFRIQSVAYGFESRVYGKGLVFKIWGVGFRVERPAGQVKASSNVCRTRWPLPPARRVEQPQSSLQGLTLRV